ncbi:MAG TPA: ATP-binding cassette domain-containing protein [Prolixibacteraceae bacterium]|nr:ATP-binding cassette domain-containing protein [Prolixibacteraceae bacterium]
MGLEIRNISKKYQDLRLFEDFSAGFEEGKITCILGPSGCGKTTLLNIIGGIVKPDEGNLDGFEGKTVSYIFQDPRLMPWKTVRGNIEFVLGNEIPATEKQEIVDHFIQLVGLKGFENFFPAKLSGGMRQRVSIARAFAYPSEIILMDEPLKGLDIKLKLNLIRTFTRIWENDKRTVIFVTHDVDEALLLGDEIIVFSPAPVRILTHQGVDLTQENRSLESEKLSGVKNLLYRALNHQ